MGPAGGGTTPNLGGSAPDLPAAPQTGDASEPVQLDPSAPELPAVEVPQSPSSLPQVEVPTVPLPSADQVTDTLPPLP